MIKFKGIVIYLGTLAWGWRMFGVGWKTTWFLGLSIKTNTKSESKGKRPNWRIIVEDLKVAA